MKKGLKTAAVSPEGETAGRDIYRFSRFLYILEAAIEYFISLFVTGAYLAKVTAYIGLSDGVTGILSGFVSLGCGFQIFAVFLAHRQPVKRWVTLWHTINQLAFACIYLIPFLPIPYEAVGILFGICLLTGHIINNVVNSPKIHWFMSLVDDQKRGDFTANKEIVSLIGGMVFTFVLGRVIDGYELAGNDAGALVFCGICLFVLMVLHTLTMVFSREKPAEVPTGEQNRGQFRALLRDKGLVKVILIPVLWSAASSASTPFYGTYQTKELGFSMTFVSILAALYAIFRSLVSKPLGRYADKHSFVKMLNICFVIQLVSFGVNVFTVPANGKVMFTLYYILHAVAMGGINSGSINLVYDYVSPDKRVAVLAVQNTIAGFTGFLTTLVVSRLVDAIQHNGNRFLGIPVYAQQVVSGIALLLVVGILVYLNTMFAENKRK